MNEMIPYRGHYYFDGSAFELLGLRILTGIVTFITLGIAYPWAVTMLYAWEASHTVLDGRRLKFTGTALGLFTLWIKWLVLIVITFGIYSFWVDISVRKWKTEHLIFEN